MVELSGVVRNPAAVVGPGNVAVVGGETKFAYPVGACAFAIMVGEHVLKVGNGGNPFNVSGPISGTGKVEIRGPRASTPRRPGGCSAAAT